MLLRLLPTATPAQPSPPTILFTLPLPASPYTSRALPLPPNLLAHRSLCLQEDIECANVLLGDKASWISGIVDNVTFSLPHSTIVVHLVDGSTMSVELGDDCIALLHRVVGEVQLSFAAAAASAAPTPPLQASPAESPRPSDRSPGAHGGASSRTSSILYSIIQPLLPTAAAPATPPAHVTAHMQPARAHRRQARSLLVDAYRRYVLPCLKDRLPSAYLLWAIQSETDTKMDEYTGLRDSMNHVLCATGLGPIGDDQAVGFYDSASSTTSYSQVSSRSSNSHSSFDTDSSAPQNFLRNVPPAHALPPKHRVAYGAQLTRLTQLSARVGSITKLACRYDCEESKRKYLEQVDLNRDGDKALRRAFSNGLLAGSSTLSSTPVGRSGLCHSVTAADLEAQERGLSCQAAASATAALEDILEVASDEDDLSEPDLSDSRSSASASPEPVPRTPTQDRTSAFGDDDDDDDDMLVTPRPSHKGFEDSPMLIPSQDDEWDMDNDLRIASIPSTPPLSFDGKKRLSLPPLPAQPQWRV